MQFGYDPGTAGSLLKQARCQTGSLNSKKIWNSTTSGRDVLRTKMFANFLDGRTSCLLR